MIFGRCRIGILVSCRWRGRDAFGVFGRFEILGIDSWRPLTPVEARTHTIILLNEYPSIKSSLRGSYSRRLLNSVRLVIKALSCQDTHIKYEVK